MAGTTLGVVAAIVGFGAAIAARPPARRIPIPSLHLGLGGVLLPLVVAMSVLVLVVLGVARLPLPFCPGVPLFVPGLALTPGLCLVSEDWTDRGTHQRHPDGGEQAAA